MGNWKTNKQACDLIDEAYEKTAESKDSVRYARLGISAKIYIEYGFILEPCAG